MTASVERPPPRHRPAIWAADGGSIPSTSSSRAEFGSTAPSSAPLTSRIGAIDRAIRAHHSGGTKSGLISGSVSSIACWTRTRSPSTTTTAWHSAGSSFSPASRQTA